MKKIRKLGSASARKLLLNIPSQVAKKLEECGISCQNVSIRHINPKHRILRTSSVALQLVKNTNLVFSSQMTNSEY